MPDQPNDLPEEDSEEGTTSTDGAEKTASADPDEAVTDSASPADEDSSAMADSIDLGDAQGRAREAAEQLLEHEFEGVIKVETRDKDGWRTVVEVVERSAVPDTQDIIGRYEITLDHAGSITGYELLERYRRGEMKEEL